MGQKQKRNKIIVNFITSLRVMGALIMVPIYLLCGKFVSFVVAGVIFLTDSLDGFLARKLHVQSFFGSILDGLSDKMFGIVVLIILSLVNKLFIIPIILELTIMLINLTSIKRGNNVKSSILGKIKTFFLDVVLVVSLLGSKIDKVVFVSAVVGIPVVITCELVVIVDYFFIMFKQEKKRGVGRIKKKAKLKTRKQILNDLFDTDFYLNHCNDDIKSLLYVNE